MQITIDRCYKFPAQSQRTFPHTGICYYKQIKVRINDAFIVHSTNIVKADRQTHNRPNQYCITVIQRYRIVDNLI